MMKYWTWQHTVLGLGGLMLAAFIVWKVPGVVGMIAGSAALPLVLTAIFKYSPKLGPAGGSDAAPKN